MFYFGCANTECQRAERAVCGSMAVTADNSHAWLGPPQFWTNDMYNAAMRTIHTVQSDPEFSSIDFHLFDLRGG